MQEARDLKEYRREINAALGNDFLRQAMDKFASAYRTGRENAFSGLDADGLISEIAYIKDQALGRLDALLEQFTLAAEKAGAKVHMARNALEANDIITRIAEENDVRAVIKAKSMTAEEIQLNHRLEALGLEVTETDLGEWIIQLRHEGPSHMVMPAIHLSRYQVADLFTRVTGWRQDSEIERLVKVARRELRPKFAEADMGITGANFAIAETGTIGLTTNEGNARLVATLPRIHVALVGLDKLLPSLEEALTINRVLPKNATGQAITSYVTWITGPNECGSSPDGVKQMHIVFLDNGRRDMAKSRVFSQVLRCVRCGACANVCPVYRMVGGHQYGHIYIGAIGLILTYFFHGREKARNLVQNCINCGACQAVCAAGIELPRIIKEVQARILKEEGRPLPTLALGQMMRNRKLFHAFLRSARAVQKPVTGGTPYLRHLPQIFAKDQNFRVLPALADKPFRDKWPEIRPKTQTSALRVGLFSGCVQDFVYPEHLEAGVKLLKNPNINLDFPMEQSCCGLPLEMMGEKKASLDVARQNINAFESGRFDYIITLCASCASHLKNSYPRLMEKDGVFAKKAREFADKIHPLSEFLNDIIEVDEDEFEPSGQRAAWHAPCHLCRGLGITDAPRELLQKAGLTYTPTSEEQTCCGFGGTYSAKFPEISAEILNRKLMDVKEAEAELLVTECPGCVMQLRGGAMKRNLDLEVKHIAEVLLERKISASKSKS